MEYRVADSHYSISYCALREEHCRQVALSDEEFLQHLPAALHLACIIGWFKELGAEATIGDAGIVHELVHLLDGCAYASLAEIRGQFAERLRLA